MTRLLDQAIGLARSLRPDVQDEIARMVLSYAGDDGSPVDLTVDEETAVLLSRAAASRGDFATDDDLAAIKSKYRP